MHLTYMLTPDCLVKHTDYGSSTPQNPRRSREKAKEAPLPQSHLCRIQWRVSSRAHLNGWASLSLRGVQRHRWGIQRQLPQVRASPQGPTTQQQERCRSPEPGGGTNLVTATTTSAVIPLTNRRTYRSQATPSLSRSRCGA